MKTTNCETTDLIYAVKKVRLQLFALAYNLGNFLRHLALQKTVKQWSLRTLRVKLINIGTKVIRHSRYVIFQMAEVLVSKRLFQEILERTHRLEACVHRVRLMPRIAEKLDFQTPDTG